MPVGATYRRSLPDMKAMDRANDAARSVAPKFTMRPKVAFGSQPTSSTSKDTAGPLDFGKVSRENPKWSMRWRTCKLGQVPGQTTDGVPGPGTYPVPATTTFDHPTLPMPGRTTMKGPERPMNYLPKQKCPGPGAYDTKDFYKIKSGRPPQFTMRLKPEIGGQSRKVSCHTMAGHLDYGKVRHEPPHYSMRWRTCKLMQMPGQTTDGVPGPGQYPVPVTTNLDHPTQKMPGKFKMPQEERFKVHINCEVYDGSEVKVGHTARFGPGYRPHERIPKTK